MYVKLDSGCPHISIHDLQSPNPTLLVQFLRRKVQIYESILSCRTWCGLYYTWSSNSASSELPPADMDDTLFSSTACIHRHIHCPSAETLVSMLPHPLHCKLPYASISAPENNSGQEHNTGETGFGSHNPPQRLIPTGTLCMALCVRGREVARRVSSLHCSACVERLCLHNHGSLLTPPWAGWRPCCLPFWPPPLPSWESPSHLAPQLVVHPRTYIGTRIQNLWK